jgi:bifunctional UDP-N-acetylglucosamine pyrophosphorylase / glucosamine-1-phosphate N-acetyltransferase
LELRKFNRQDLMPKTKVLILAAGEGTRMKSDLPKVLHEAAGDSLVGHVIRAARTLRSPIGLVVGRGADQVRERLGPGFRYFVQKRRLGSGHAVMSASAWLAREKSSVVVLCGDAPLLKAETIRRLVETHRRERNAVTLLTARVKDPFGYGRIVRVGGRPRAIVEERDASPHQRAIDEINSGTYCFESSDLLRALRRIRPDNAKGEYYLTDAVSLLVRDGRPVGAFVTQEEQVLGVNRRGELAEADRILRRRILERLMDDGVSVLDPASTYVDVDVSVGRDTTILPQTFLKGKTRVGSGCRLGPFSYLEDCRLGDRVEFRASFAYGAALANDVKVGPFSHIRQGTRSGAGARIGNFVEVKKSRLGRGAKLSHLTYIGDAAVGEDVNIGAGVITCNYDGVQKNKTFIGAGAFVGSNVNLVAPVRVGKGAIIGAGSTIVRNVPADALALERAQSVIKPGWARRRREGKSRK